MKEVPFNSGIVEGLKIAKTYVVKEFMKNTESKKLLRILVEIENAIQHEHTNIRLQRLNCK